MIASPGLSRAAATVENRVVQSIPLDDVRFATTISHHRCACWVRGVNGVLAAVRAGLGIAVMARTLTPADLVELPPSHGLPKLPHLDLVLLTHKAAPAEAAKALTSAILASGSPLKPVTGG